MTLEYLSEKLIHEFSVLEPFGKGNEKPVFADKELRVRDIRIVGTNRKFVRMKLVDKTNRSYQAICFDGDAYENQKYLEDHKENLFYSVLSADQYIFWRGTDRSSDHTLPLEGGMIEEF